MLGNMLPRFTVHDIAHGGLVNTIVSPHRCLRLTCSNTSANNTNVIREQSTLPSSKFLCHIRHVVMVGSKEQMVGANTKSYITGVTNLKARLNNRAKMQLVGIAVGRNDAFRGAKFYATIARFLVRRTRPQPACFSLMNPRPETLLDGNSPAYPGARITTELSGSLLLLPFRQSKRRTALFTGKGGLGTSGPGRTPSRTKISLALADRLEKREESSPTMGTLTRKFATLSRHLISNQMGVTAPDVPASRGFFTFNSITLPGVYLMKEV